MPSPEQILHGLTDAANAFLPLAIMWHLAVLAAVVAIAWQRWRPTFRTAMRLLALPLVSVSVLALATNNPFNAASFLLFAAVSLVLARQAPRVEVSAGPPWASALGAVVLAYAWAYPHFLEEKSPALYAIAAPMGLIPCPTLSMVIGFGLLGGGLGSRAWSLTMGAVALFYALFGMLRLGVFLDAGLLVAGVGICMVALLGHSRSDATSGAVSRLWLKLRARAH